MRKGLGRRGRRQTQLSWTDIRKRVYRGNRRDKEKRPYSIYGTYISTVRKRQTVHNQL